MLLPRRSSLCFFFFFNDTATTEIYTLSLHDALPISNCRTDRSSNRLLFHERREICRRWNLFRPGSAFLSNRDALDRKSTRLNSSHLVISYAVFCLKKKKNLHTSNPHCTHTLPSTP